MILINQASLDAARSSGQDLLEKLAKELLPASSPHHEARAKEFMEAAAANDDQRVNTMLKEALERYFGEGDLMAALGDFCQRLGLPSDVMTLGEAGALQWISDHYAEISKKLNEELKNAAK